jgi:hypothetical protein
MQRDQLPSMKQDNTAPTAAAAAAQQQRRTTPHRAPPSDATPPHRHQQPHTPACSDHVHSRLHPRDSVRASTTRKHSKQTPRQRSRLPEVSQPYINQGRRPTELYKPPALGHPMLINNPTYLHMLLDCASYPTLPRSSSTHARKQQSIIRSAKTAQKQLSTQFSQRDASTPHR